MNPRQLPLLVFASLFALAPLAAAQADGTYQITLAFRNESYTYDDAFTVSGGSISGAYEGTVSSGGAVSMRGPCPINPGLATFTGTLYSDATATGSWECDNPGQGSWNAVRTSSGGGIPGTGGSAASILIASLVGIGAIAAIGGAWKAGQKKRALQAAARQAAVGPGTPPGWTPVVPAQPAAPAPGPFYPWMRTPQWAATPPSAAPSETGPAGGWVEVGGGQSIGGVGVQVAAPPPHPPIQNLRLMRAGNQVNLSWDEPQVDPRNAERLDHYSVFELRYGPQSTAPQAQFLGNLPPGSTNTQLPFQQTHQWNTSGDIAGYRVEPWYQSLGGDAAGRIVPGGGAFVAAPY